MSPSPSPSSTPSPGGATVTPLATYRNETPYPFCPGCGHSTILDRLNDALVALGRAPSEIVLVSDIGCSGLSDQYFVTSAFHGLHGRAITYATGIKLVRPELEVIVVMGDGGTGIGGAHLLNAARRNIGITVLVFNNFNYGMTGGQHSATTPPGAVTSTTPGGNLERPLDLCATVAANGASYVYRGTSFDKTLAERIADGIRTPGFALLDVWELCTAHFVPGNKASKRTLSETLDRLGFESGVIRATARPDERPEYAAAYREAHHRKGGREAARTVPGPQPLPPRFEARLDRRFEIVVAGAAGGKVRSAARTVARAAVLSGLWAAQRDDYPVTVKTGHSVAHLILSPERIEHSGSSGRPDAVLLLAEEGRKKIAGTLSRMEEGSALFVLPGLAGSAELDTGGVDGASRHVLDPEAAAGATGGRIAKPQLALFALAAMVARLDRERGLFPPEALEEAVRQGPPDLVEKSLAGIRAGLSFSSTSCTTPR
ncbi:MAG: thiamine pyrophosphate-dependent enzyme [Acidobacteriota bacterium]|jgi:pyruvate/2-oxoacid:ferredoxin oxidoreductase beta subunit/Pyruvate/2-oxoacid:ferredoxin oxidoreductase gamma subunit